MAVRAMEEGWEDFEEGAAAALHPSSDDGQQASRQGRMERKLELFRVHDVVN